MNERQYYLTKNTSAKFMVDFISKGNKNDIIRIYFLLVSK